MTRKVFFSFHFDSDSWRAGQVRNMGVVDGSEPVKGNRWEDVKSKSEEVIKQWIDDNLKDKSCLVVLIGEKTASRKWVKYEIDKAVELGKGICGVYIHKLKDQNGKTSKRGSNPLLKDAPIFDSQYQSSDFVYNDIKENIADLVEKAIKIRDEDK
ncbi:TIR domain-containing protein [Haemophilus haemolyticus]|uniref:TIR domain-containing protein n=1 Tax=Haemophilus haemolyticus TaxID=726 RepID=UPI000E569272|nr:TIR domain-containing protein [Haemophilus haemolyticus]